MKYKIPIIVRSRQTACGQTCFSKTEKENGLFNHFLMWFFICWQRSLSHTHTHVCCILSFNLQFPWWLRDCSLPVSCLATVSHYMEPWAASFCGMIHLSSWVLHKVHVCVRTHTHKHTCFVWPLVSTHVVTRSFKNTAFKMLIWNTSVYLLICLSVYGQDYVKVLDRFWKNFNHR